MPEPCKHSVTRVVDSRHSPAGIFFTVVRVRECLECGEMLRTREVIDSSANEDRRVFKKLRYNHSGEVDFGYLQTTGSHGSA